MRSHEGGESDFEEWSGRPGSNRRHPAWEAGVLLPRNSQIFQIQPVANNGNHSNLLRLSHPSHDLHGTPLLSRFSYLYGQYGQYEISGTIYITPLQVWPWRNADNVPPECETQCAPLVVPESRSDTGIRCPCLHSPPQCGHCPGRGTSITSSTLRGMGRRHRRPYWPPALRPGFCGCALGPRREKGAA